MLLRYTLSYACRIAYIIAICSTLYLYLYPFWHRCAFPRPDSLSLNDGLNEPSSNDFAPLRLLVLADPQLEGDTSLPDPEDGLMSRLSTHWRNLRTSNTHDFTTTLQAAAVEFFSENLSTALQTVRKTLDLFGNDYYLAHIYRTLHWWTQPTHVTVLGDLIGSQWLDDEEFERRGWRFWNRVFRGGEKVGDEYMHMYEKDGSDQAVIPLLKENQNWSKKIINVVGNHDIGYAGDISTSRLERFERVFGKPDWDIKFSYPLQAIPDQHKNNPAPLIHLIVLNDMMLDGPVHDQTLQGKTYEYINGLISSRLNPVEERNRTFNLLLTHVPLHKPAGVCVDEPFFDFWDFEDADGKFKSGALREQNTLSEFVSHSGILQSIFGMSGNLDANAGGKGRNGLILNGHDHEGCDVVHYIARHEIEQERENEGEIEDTDVDTEPGLDPNSAWSWHSVRTKQYQAEIKNNDRADIVTSLREVTLRSMMGDFGGNAGLLSLWFDFDAHDWRFEIQMCQLGVQHIWWAVHVIDIIAILVCLVNTLVWFVGRTKTSSISAGIGNASSTKQAKTLQSPHPQAKPKARRKAD